MKHNNFGYLLGEGFRAIFKHGFMSFAAICITVACLVIVGSFTLLTFNLNEIVEDIQEQNRILVCIDETYTRAQATNVGSQINLLDNVANAQFVSRDQALADFIGDSDASLYEGLTAETMRDQFIITLENNDLTNETLAALEEVPGVAAVYADPEMANSMATIRNLLSAASIAVTVVLTVVSLVIISNTIKLTMLDRKEEIAIMRMVGATNGFIRFPFVIEGFLIGVCGAVASFFLEWGLYETCRTAIGNTDLDFVNVVPFAELMVPFAIVCAAAGLLIGVLGSLLSIRRFLKV